MAGRIDRRDGPLRVRGERRDRAGHGRIVRDAPVDAGLSAQRADIGECVSAQRNRENQNNFPRVVDRVRLPPRRQRVRQRCVEFRRSHWFGEQETARLPERGDPSRVDVNSRVRFGILQLEGAPFWKDRTLRQAQLFQIRSIFSRRPTPQRREP